MIHEETSFRTGDKLMLYSQQWRPETDPKAIIAVVHGTFEHSGRYKEEAQYLVRQGFAVYGFDLRGHGRSDGERGFFASFNILLEDLKHFLNFVKERQPGKPVFVLGHSAGASIALLFSLLHKEYAPNGLILSAPALKLSNGVSRSALMLSRFLGRAFPRIKLTTLDPALLSQDPAVVGAYRNDPLVNQKGLPALPLAEFLHAVNSIYAQLEQVRLPLLILHGTDDRIADPQGSRDLYAQSLSGDKTLKLYDRFFHEVLHEPGREQVLQDISAWLNKRT
ncbi:MAG: lysophospholipase [Candidatus Omnitrophica bacterium]|nr:lysophospholipase [Candidatus Omnitrophota bacterium]